MKRTGVLAGILTSVVILTAFSGKGDFHSLAKYTSGGPVAYAGDPASGNKNCTQCHSGTAVETVTGWISSDIPESGYLPNTTYTITATASGDGISKFGFQISPQSSDGTFLGTLASLDDQSKLTTDVNYITHSSSGTAGEGTKSWSFQWTSPEAGSGALSFYGAFNLSNANGSTSGDMIKLSTLAVMESVNSIFEYTDNKRLQVYPNPASRHLTFVVEPALLGSGYSVIDLSGRIFKTGVVSNERTLMQVNDLASGTYFIQIGSEAKRKFIVVKE